MEFLWTSHFAGCGGATLGAIAAGFKSIFAIENDPGVAGLYQRNIGCVTLADVTEFNTQTLEIPTASDRRRNNQILISQISPPCQDYSSANNKARDHKSQRAKILNSSRVLEYYRLFEPEYIILENVPEFRQSAAFLEFKKFLAEIGYSISDYILNASDFGVAQQRKRLFMVATRTGFLLPKINPTHEEFKIGQLSLFKNTLKPWKGWLDAIAHLTHTFQPIEPTKSQQHVLYGDNLLLERVGYFDKPKTAEPNTPAWTIRACLGSDGKGGERGKVIDALIDGEFRSLSVDAIAALQSFPDWYQWSGKPSVDIKGIGNSVCPLVSQVICESIKSMIL